MTNAPPLESLQTIVDLSAEVARLATAHEAAVAKLDTALAAAGLRRVQTVLQAQQERRREKAPHGSIMRAVLSVLAGASAPLPASAFKGAGGASRTYIYVLVGSGHAVKADAGFVITDRGREWLRHDAIRQGQGATADGAK